MIWILLGSIAGTAFLAWFLWMLWDEELLGEFLASTAIGITGLGSLAAILYGLQEIGVLR